jgi:hypothetical protein
MESRVGNGGSPQEEPDEIQKGVVVHRVEGEVIFASQGYRILRSPDAGKTWSDDGWIPVPWWRRVIDSHPLMRRMSRGGVVGVWPQADGSRLCIVPKMVMRAEAGSSTYRRTFRFARGSRPLNLCEGKDGEIYWGEYFLNLRRSEPVRIFGSEDKGRHWEVVYTFPKGTICHVHRIVYDPFWDTVLVCTGDRNHEVAILKTTDGFKTLEPVVQGEQHYRTTCLLPLPDCILYGTDNPNGDNYVMAIDRQSGSVEKIQQLPGPVLYGCQVGEVAVFGTMVEKKEHEVTLWAGNEKSFRLVAHFKTRKANQLWREAAGYSTVILPEGTGRWPYLFLTPIGTQKYANSLLRINLEKVGLSERKEQRVKDQEQDPPSQPSALCYGL